MSRSGGVIEQDGFLSLGERLRSVFPGEQPEAPPSPPPRSLCGFPGWPSAFLMVLSHREVRQNSIFCCDSPSPSLQTPGLSLNKGNRATLWCLTMLEILSMGLDEPVRGGARSAIQICPCRCTCCLLEAGIHKRTHTRFSQTLSSLHFYSRVSTTVIYEGCDFEAYATAAVHLFTDVLWSS